MGWRHNVVLSNVVTGWRCEMKVCLLFLCLCLGYCKSICYFMHSREDVFGCFSISCRRQLLSYCICRLRHSFLVLLFQEDDNEPNCHLLVDMFAKDDTKPITLVYIFFLGSTKVNNELRSLLFSSFFCCCFRKDNDEMTCHWLLSWFYKRWQWGSLSFFSFLCCCIA